MQRGKAFKISSVTFETIKYGCRENVAGSKVWFFLLFSAIITASILPAAATNVVAATANRSALLGGGYQSEKESISPQRCVTGTESMEGVAQANFSFDQALSEKEVSEQLGLAAGGRSRFGAAEASGSAKFSRSAVSNEYSLSAVWLSEYRLPSRKLDALSLSPIGEAVKNNIERWAQTCGDEYIDEITVGARLFFSIRIDFSSKERKEEFAANFSVSGPLYSANANLEQASKQFGKDAKITVTAFQIGGDVSKVTGIFPNTPEGTSNFVQCGLGDLKQCSSVIKSALIYATDTTSGFPSQLAPGVKPGGAPIQYKSAKYPDAGIYLPTGYPYLTQVVAEARKRLHSHFEREFGRLILANRLTELGMGKDQLDAVVKQRNIVDNNLTKILDVSKVCYEEVEKCVAAVQGIVLGQVDDSVFVLPELPRASYRLMTTSRGVWPRAESVATMMTPVMTAYGPRRRDLSSIAPTESTSIVLYIEGIGLRSAQLYFENLPLKTIPLAKAAGAFNEKYGDRSAAIVVDTTRSNPGWRDVDLWEERKKLWKGTIPQGDGVFYLIVSDVFGRDVKFDVEYQKWSRTVAATPNVNGGQTANEKFSYKNRWWSERLQDRGGTWLAGSGPEVWTDEGSAALSLPASD